MKKKFIFFHYCYKSKKLECQEEFFFYYLKKKNKTKQEEIVYVNDDKENFNEKINLQNDKHDHSINLDGID